jgi:hypothetical protein
MQYIQNPWANTYMGEAGTPISDFNDVIRLPQILMTPETELPLLIVDTTLSEGLRRIASKRLSGEIIINSGSGWEYARSGPWNLYTYECNPQDDWANWGKLFLEDLFGFGPGFCGTFNLNYFMAVNAAMRAVKERHNWDGDIRDTVYISAVPSGDSEGGLIVALKQDNNGETYFASPVELKIDYNDYCRPDR